MSSPDERTTSLAVDLGGTKTTVARVTGDGTVRGRRTVPTGAAGGPGDVVAGLVAALGATLAEATAAGERPTVIGIGSAGVIDSSTGRVTSATDAIPGWAGTHLGRLGREAVGLETHVLNDVHAHGLGEAVYGSGSGRSSMLLVAVGTGIGGAFVLEGRVVLGAHSAAAHVGHVPVPEADDVPCPCGRVGHLEGLASGPGILAAYRRAGGVAADTREVAARAGTDPLAREILTRCARATGRVVGGLLNVLDPELVVLSGGVSEAGEAWWDAVRAGIALDAMTLVSDTPVVAASAGPDAALLGAAHFARTHDRQDTP
ncbi:ROK family protein [Pseudactinotalea sp. HY158]|uniref:ROK family protein n=1 Tax=Pseudactinotalea sp. HY158 TaxID=2654547 RepID=UPI00129C7A5D|nr:ROK family protein [Pseudactinotalea sp. HY158]QGH68376.1 ROK family protein [Pseudactinotalea sp. HY158]